MFDILKELKKEDADRIKGLSSILKSTKNPDNIPEEAKFKFKVSSESVDRDGEILKADGADLEYYRRNPIVLANHWYSVENIIGKTTKIWQEGTDTYAEGYFSQTNPKAKLIQDLYNEGMVKVVSVGFMVKERDAKDRNIITKWEMLEFSICAVQSNRDAESMDGKQKELMRKGLDSWLIKLSDPKAEKTIHTKDSLIGDEKSIDTLLMEELEKENNNPEEWKYIVDVYEKGFVYNVYGKGSDTYYYRAYERDGNTVTLIGEDIEVEPIRQWVEKSATWKLAIWQITNSIKEVSKGFEEMKNLVTALANDKAKEEKEVIENAKALKRPMQNLVNGVSQMLEAQKKL